MKLMNVLTGALVALMLLVALPVAAECFDGNDMPPTEDCGNTYFKYKPVDEYGVWTWMPDGEDPMANPYNLILVTVDGKYFDWSVEDATFTGEIRVKAGNGYCVYTYDDATGDTGLHGPVNPSGDYADISHVSVCGEVTLEECWCGETAWAAGDRYVRKGNWATYTPYVSGSPVTLYAGQTMEAGTVSFSPVTDGHVEICIALNEGWRFAEVFENVKIQDYAEAPSGNPSPGLFDWKFTVPTVTCPFVVDAKSFYGVHADLEYLCECTE